MAIGTNINFSGLEIQGVDQSGIDTEIRTHTEIETPTDKPGEIPVEDNNDEVEPGDPINDDEEIADEQINAEKE